MNYQKLPKTISYPFEYIAFSKHLISPIRRQIIDIVVFASKVQRTKKPALSIMDFLTGIDGRMMPVNLPRQMFLKILQDFNGEGVYFDVTAISTGTLSVSIRWKEIAKNGRKQHHVDFFEICKVHGSISGKNPTYSEIHILDSLFKTLGKDAYYKNLNSYNEYIHELNSRSIARIVCSVDNFRQFIKMRQRTKKDISSVYRESNFKEIF